MWFLSGENVYKEIERIARKHVHSRSIPTQFEISELFSLLMQNKKISEIMLFDLRLQSPFTAQIIGKSFIHHYGDSSNEKKKIMIRANGCWEKSVMS